MPREVTPWLTAFRAYSGEASRQLRRSESQSTQQRVDRMSRSTDARSGRFAQHIQGGSGVVS